MAKTAQAQQSKNACKMSASLAALLISGKGKAPQKKSLALGLASSSMTTSEPSLHVFVRLNDASKSTISGVSLSKGPGKVFTAMVPLSKIAAFAKAKQIDRVSAPRQLRPLMDVASTLVRIPAFKNTTGTSGKEVIIGVVDTGIDPKHPAFAGRVLSLWDQTIDGQGPGVGFSRLGVVLTGPAMQASRDTHGHGTHVAGIAGGAGSAFEGIAPKAKFIIVKTNFQNSGIAEGVRWIFSEATRLGRPCVINLSLGGHGDGHDGLDDLSIAVSDECGPGRLVVAAAGNEGGDAMHVSQVITANQPGQFKIKVNGKSSPVPSPFFWLNGWYSGSSVCEIRVISSTGASTPWQGLIANDPGAVSFNLANDKVTISSPDQVAPNGDRQFVIEVEGKTGLVQGGTWRVEVRRKSGNPGETHVWLNTDPDAPQSAQFLKPSFTHLIGSPGAAENAITVAAYTSRNAWVSLSGDNEAVGLKLDTASEFSSPGPLRKGGLKPDVTAPGAMIASCLSADCAVNQEDVIAKQYQVMAGTSMASPFIAGLLALLLEQKPQTTPAEAKKWLKTRSSVPGVTAGTHDTKWGYGVVKL